VAPSLILVEAGDRIKTDRRDAMMLAKLHDTGELSTIWIPAATHEVMRDLVRARATEVRVLSKTRQHLQDFLLRHDLLYRGARAWTLAYRRWLTTVRFDHPALQEYIHAVPDAEARRDRLTWRIEELLPNWLIAPVTAALQVMRGGRPLGRSPDRRSTLTCSNTSRGVSGQIRIPDGGDQYLSHSFSLRAPGRFRSQAHR